MLGELQQVQLAIDLVELGARIQVLESETGLSRARLLKLYKEVRGNSPPRGMLPFSTDWFVTWLPNIHSSLFYNFYLQLTGAHGCKRMDGFIKAYRLYLEQMQLEHAEPVLGLTRAWTLLRFFENDLLELMPCQCCGGQFVVHAHTPGQDFVCGICAPPSRAGTARRVAQEPADLRCCRGRQVPEIVAKNSPQPGASLSDPDAPGVRLR